MINYKLNRLSNQINIILIGITWELQKIIKEILVINYLKRKIIFNNKLIGIHSHLGLIVSQKEIKIIII